MLLPVPLELENLTLTFLTFYELEAMKRSSLRFIRGHDITRTLDTFEALYRGEKVVDPDPELTDE